MKLSMRLFVIGVTLAVLLQFCTFAFDTVHPITAQAAFFLGAFLQMEITNARRREDAQ